MKISLPNEKKQEYMFIKYRTRYFICVLVAKAKII